MNFIDYNGDGTSDLICEYLGSFLKPVWIMIDGAAKVKEPVLFFDVSAAGGIELFYSDSIDKLVVEKFYGSVGSPMDAYMVFDGKIREHMAEMDGFTGEIKYTVDGVSANERLYNERVEGLELIPLDTLFPSPGSVPVLNLAGMDIAEIYAQLQSYAFIQNCEVGDFDGDGTDDLRFSCIAAPDGVENASIAFFEGANYESDYGHFTLAFNGSSGFVNRTYVLYSTGQIVIES